MPGLADFAGSWRMERRIENAAGPDARFVGHAEFRPEGDALRLSERGEMILPGVPPMKAERHYLWRAAGGLILVEFDDGRPFHGFDPHAPRPEAEHDCPPDHYRVAYDFTGWPDWSAVWRVSGPRKSYEMQTRYSRPKHGLNPAG